MLKHLLKKNSFSIMSNHKKSKVQFFFPSSRCPDSGPRATRMPTDDDYGRRERLLSHQHPQISQYNQTSSSSNPPPDNCHHGKQSSASFVSDARQAHYSSQLQNVDQHHHKDYGRYQQHATNPTDRPYANCGGGGPNGSQATGNLFSPESFPSPPSPAPTNDRFVPPPPLSPSPSDKYSSSQSLANYTAVNNKYLSCAASPASPMSHIGKERFHSSSERLLSACTASTSSSTSSVGDQSTLSTNSSSNKDQQQQQQQRYTIGGTSSTERLLASSSPVLATSERLLALSPIHAPVPERFAGGSKDSRYLDDSPIHERYHHPYSEMGTQQPQQRYSTNGSLSSANAEQLGRRYSSSSDASNCQKYVDRTSSSPAPNEYTCRLQEFQETGTTSQRLVGSADRYGDIVGSHKYGQSRQNDRFVSGERYGHGHTGHDTRQSSGEIARLVFR